MIILIHHKAQKVAEVFKDREPIKVKKKTCTGALWELAEKYPEEIIGWCETDLKESISWEKWEQIFHHDLIMASYAIDTTFLPDSIGYVDQLPFINVNREVTYPTWLMSSDIGGLKGKVLLKFKDLFEDISNLGYLITSIAKLGQQNGLFCYSDPNLIKIRGIRKPDSTATPGQLFAFVHRFYTNSWTTVLIWCKWKYEFNLPISPYLRSFLNRKEYLKDVDLSSFKPSFVGNNSAGSIDIIIPTLGRKNYLLQVLEDLQDQTYLPKNVIIIEQDPETKSSSQLFDVVNKDWSFKIIHQFIHKTGACNARNLALNEVTSEWVFFADDDIRLKPDLLHKVMEEASRFQACAINFNCQQPGEETIFFKVKQWGSFGAGTSMVKSAVAKDCSFSKEFEYGFGEDADFGMQLRNKGCDIIYHPKLELLHLKASTGGFRKRPILPWEQGEMLPKPSPTVMAYAFKYYTPEQFRGYKVSMFLKYYSKQPEKNPIKYLKILRKRWKLSEEWGLKLLNEKVSVKSSYN